MILIFVIRSIVLRKQYMLNNRGDFDILSEKFCWYICQYGEICCYYYAEKRKMFYSFVEKLCKTLGKKLRICCEKFYSLLWKKGFHVIKWWKNNVFHRTVEKFYWRFFACDFPCKNRVLHSFHIAYYYNYYLFNKGLKEVI